MNNASAEMAEEVIDMIFVEKWAKLIKTLIDASDILLPNKEELHITDLMDDMLKPEVKVKSFRTTRNLSVHLMQMTRMQLYIYLALDIVPDIDKIDERNYKLIKMT